MRQHELQATSRERAAAVCTKKCRGFSWSRRGRGRGGDLRPWVGRPVPKLLRVALQGITRLALLRVQCSHECHRSRKAASARRYLPGEGAMAHPFCIPIQNTGKQEQERQDSPPRPPARPPGFSHTSTLRASKGGPSSASDPGLGGTRSSHPFSKPLEGISTNSDPTQLRREF